MELKIEIKRLSGAYQDDKYRLKEEVDLLKEPLFIELQNTKKENEALMRELQKV